MKYVVKTGTGISGVGDELRRIVMTCAVKIGTASSSCFKRLTSTTNNQMTVYRRSGSMIPCDNTSFANPLISRMRL